MRAKWQRAHNDVQAIDHDTAAPAAYYAHSHALHVELVAVKNYDQAMHEYLAAVNRAPNATTESVPEDDHRLTPREREVLTLIASGESSKAIADQLGISFKTVVGHRYRVQKKLKAHSTADLTRAAVRMVLIDV